MTGSAQAIATPDAKSARELSQAEAFDPFCSDAQLSGLRVLLIYPPVRLSSKALYPPFGLISIAAVLERAGVHVEILDLNLLRLDFEALKKELASREFDIVGIGGMTTVYYYMKLVTRYLEREYPDVPVIGGGSACSASPRIVLERTGIDVACVGEGEPIIVQLCQTLWRGGDLAAIPGIWYRDEAGDIRESTQRARMSNIEDLPFPAYHQIDMEAYIKNTHFYKYRLNGLAKRRVEELGIDPEKAARPVVLFTKRGCPFACDFCYRNFGRKVVQTSIDYTLQHMDFLAERYNTAFFVFGDEIFNIDRKWVHELCERIVAEDRRYILATSNALRANLIDRELLTAMKSAGFCSVGIGIESFYDPTLKAMKKSQKASQIFEALRLTQELGIGISSAQLLFGYTTDGPESMEANLKALDDLKMSSGNFSIPCPYPGTELYNIALQRGLIGDEEAWLMELADKDISDRVINLSGMPDEELQRLVQYGRDQVRMNALRRKRPMVGRVFAVLQKLGRNFGIDAYGILNQCGVWAREAISERRLPRFRRRQCDEGVRDEAFALLRDLPERRVTSTVSDTIFRE